MNHQKINPGSIVILCVVAALALLPAVFSLWLSFTDYQLIKGLAGSPFVGFHNYSALFSRMEFPRLLGNSAFLWFVSLLASLVLGFGAALLCSHIADRKLAATVAGLYLIPVFIPAVCYFVIVLRGLSSMVLVKSSQYALGFAAQTLLPGASLIAFAGSVTGILYRSRGRSAATGALLGSLGAGLLFCFMVLEPSYETTLLSANPVVYTVADTFDSHAYRTGLTQVQFGLSTAAFVVRSVIQIVIAVLPAVLLGLMLKRHRTLWEADAGLMDDDAGRNSSLAFVPWTVAAVLAAALLFVRGVPGLSELPQVGGNLLSSVIAAAIAVIVGGGIALAVLYGSRGVSDTVFLVFAGLVLALSNAFIGQYLLARGAGLGDSVIANGLGVWVQTPVLMMMLVFAMVLRLSPGGRGTAPLGLALLCFIAAQAFGSMVPALYYARNPRLFSMGLFLRNMVSAPADDTQSALALVYAVTLLPCLLLGFTGAYFGRRGVLEMVKQ